MLLCPVSLQQHSMACHQQQQQQQQQASTIEEDFMMAPIVNSTPDLNPKNGESCAVSNSVGEINEVKAENSLSDSFSRNNKSLYENFNLGNQINLSPIFV